jgi:hypothetical protein
MGKYFVGPREYVFAKEGIVGINIDVENRTHEL